MLPLAGGQGNVMEKKLVVNHDRCGIVTTMLPDKNIYTAKDNVVVNNTVPGTCFADFLLGGQSDAVWDVPAGSDYRLWPAPPTQVGMAEPASAPGDPAFEVLVRPDTAVITIPKLPAGTVIRCKETAASGVPITNPTFRGSICSLWGYFVPPALIGAWMALAVWDIVRRQDEMSRVPPLGDMQ
jgi:hypothetical protein